MSERNNALEEAALALEDQAQDATIRVQIASKRLEEPKGRKHAQHLREMKATHERKAHWFGKAAEIIRSLKS